MNQPRSSPLARKLLQLAEALFRTHSYFFVRIRGLDGRIIQSRVHIRGVVSERNQVVWPEGERGELPGSFRTINPRCITVPSEIKGANQVIMEPNSGPLTEVLHSENHSKLTAEEIAKAVAHHNKNHSPAKTENALAKAKKATKK